MSLSNEKIKSGIAAAESIVAGYLAKMDLGAAQGAAIEAFTNETIPGLVAIYLACEAILLNQQTGRLSEAEVYDLAHHVDLRIAMVESEALRPTIGGHLQIALAAQEMAAGNIDRSYTRISAITDLSEMYIPRFSRLEAAIVQRFGWAARSSGLFLRSEIDTRPEDFQKARLGRIAGLRLSGNFKAASDLIKSSSGIVSEDHLKWHELAATTQRSGDLTSMVRWVLRTRNTLRTRYTSAILYLWTRAVKETYWRKAVPKVRAVADAKRDPFMEISSFDLNCLRSFESLSENFSRAQCPKLVDLVDAASSMSSIELEILYLLSLQNLAETFDIERLQRHLQDRIDTLEFRLANRLPIVIYQLVVRPDAPLDLLPQLREGDFTFFGSARQLSRAALNIGLNSLVRRSQMLLASQGQKAQLKKKELLKFAKEVVRFLQESKGALQKLNQIMRYCSYFLPEEVGKPLSEVHQVSAEIEFDEIRRTLKESLNRELSEVFGVIEETPLASASIGQVHRAMVEEKEVVVKVQHRKTSEKVRRQMRSILLLFPVMERFFPVMNLHSLAIEFTSMITRELDYGLEIEVQHKFETLQLPARIVVPKVYPQWSGTHHIVSEYLHGMTFDDWFRATTKEEHNQAGLLLVEGLMAARFQGMMHLDPQPGNFLFLPNGNVAILDFGAVEVEPHEQNMMFLDFYHAVSAGDDAMILATAHRNGLLLEGSPYDKGAFCELIRHDYQPYVVDSPFRFTKQYLTESQRLNAINSRYYLVPADLLGHWRFHLGLSVTLIAMQAEGNFHRIVRPIIERHSTLPASPPRDRATDCIAERDAVSGLNQKREI